MPENPHIEGGELDNAATNIDPRVSIDIDPATQLYAQSADAVIASLQGDSLAMARVKQALPPLLAGLQAAAGVVPGAGTAISGAIGVINAIAGKIQ